MPRKRASLADKIGIEQVMNALNLGRNFSSTLNRHSHDLLVRTTQMWIDSGRNLDRMERRRGDPSFEKMARVIQGIVVRGPKGTARMILVPATGVTKADGASLYFMQLVLNPLRARLRPPCIQCGKWHIEERTRDSNLCGRPCRDAWRLREKRRGGRDAKLERAQRALNTFADRPEKWKSLSWKEWVVQAEHDISINFLTHAMNVGDLREPDVSRMDRAGK